MGLGNLTESEDLLATPPSSLEVNVISASPSPTVNSPIRNPSPASISLRPPPQSRDPSTSLTQRILVKFLPLTSMLRFMSTSSSGFTVSTLKPSFPTSSPLVTSTDLMAALDSLTLSTLGLTVTQLSPVL